MRLPLAGDAASPGGSQDPYRPHEVLRGAARGRGAASNPPNRFDAHWRERDDEGLDPFDGLDEDEAGERLRTVLIDDASKSALTRNDSPDVGFDVSLNPYRGCEHGCIYCYARPTHEYLGLSAGLDFESKIVVKREAPRLLRQELARPSWRPTTIAISGVTDCYQPIERRLRLTRGCLEVLAECRNPVVIVTKNHGVTRDLDLLTELAAYRAAAVLVSITSLDDELSGALEPRASRPRRRLAAVRALARAGVPVGVMVAPVIPGLNDREVPAILEAAAEAGAQRAGRVLLRLPHAVAPLFEDWLDRHRPRERDKVLALLRAARGGKLNDPRFGSRMRGEGPYAEQIARLFEVTCARLGLATSRPFPLSTAAFRRPGGPSAQLELF